MGGLFAVASHQDCVEDLFFGTDYHSHLATRRGGMAVSDKKGITRFIHDITNAPFRSKFENDMRKLKGNLGIGVISDFEDQPLIIGSHLGTYAIVTVGYVQNSAELARQAFSRRATHFSEMSGDGINATELVATLINREATFEDGIRSAQKAIKGSCSLLLLTDKGILVARDLLGRTPLIVGRGKKGYAVTMESCAFPNLEYSIERNLGPGEVILLTPDGIEQRLKPLDRMQICSFFWIYYGYPASTYEGINVEDVRNRCGAALAKRDRTKMDIVAGIPDSGTGHALGYATESGTPLRRPLVKYTPTWPRSFTPQDQNIRELVARMKLIPIKEVVNGKKILFCDDSIIRGNQLKDIIKTLIGCGAKEVHLRTACPPFLHPCKFLHFSRTRSALDLATRKVIKDLEGNENRDLDQYSDPTSEKHQQMIKAIASRLSLTSLKYQNINDMVEAIGLPKCRLCTYCWDGVE